jgi:hypothetical protein
MLRTVILVLLGSLAGPGRLVAEDLPVAGELACDRRDPGPCTASDERTGLMVRLPGDWPLRRVGISTFSGPSASARLYGAERVVWFEYRPEEPANPAVLLFEAIVLPRVEWLKLSQRGGPSPGVEVAENRSRVVVARRLDENPYPPDTRDAAIFEALTPSLQEISLIVTLP